MRHTDRDRPFAEHPQDADRTYRGKQAYFGKGTAEAGLYDGIVAGNPPRQSVKRNKAVMEQGSRWLVQEPLRMGWYRLYARVLCPVYCQLGTMA